MVRSTAYTSIARVLKIWDMFAVQTVLCDKVGTTGMVSDD